MTNIEDYKQNLRNLIEQCYDKTIIGKILDILSTSIDKTFSDNINVIESGIEELEMFRKMWGREYNNATYFIATGYEKIFRKLPDESSMKLNVANKAITEFESYLQKESFLNNNELRQKCQIEESINKLEEYITKHS